MDIDSVLIYLHLPKTVKPSGKNGYEKLKQLHRKSNKTYVKGAKTNKFVSSLDMEQIVDSLKKELNPLFRAFRISPY